MCNGTECVCMDEYTMGDAGYSCHLNLKLGDNCTSDEDCIGLANGICDSNSSVCVCPDDRVEIDGYCYDGIELNERCTTDEQCEKITSDSRCYKSYCQCEPGYYTADSTATVCQEEARTFDTCTTNNDCEGHSYICVNQACACEADYVDVDEICYRKAGLTKSCENNDQCTALNENSECKAGTDRCGCTDGFQSKDGMCVEVFKEGDACLANSDCGDAVCEDSLCVCTAKQVKVNDKCYNHKDFMESCENDGQCQAVTSGSVCVTFCVCPAPLENYGDNQCQTAVRVGDVCSSDSDCGPSSILSCTAGFCLCGSDQVQLGNKCYPERDPLQSCVVSEQCRAANSYCGLSYKCVCDDGFWESMTECRPVVPLGGACEYDMDCYKSDPNTRCRAGICTEYSLICHETTIGGYHYRLANSADDCKAGRMEVRREGVDEPWGVVCQVGFNNAAGKVFCKSIGFNNVFALFPNSVYDSGSGLYYLTLSGGGCTGTETHLADCSVYGWGEAAECSEEQVMAIRCQ